MATNFFSSPERLNEIWAYPFHMGRDSFIKVKWLGREADHSPPFTVKVKKEWSYIPTLPYAFMLSTRSALLCSSSSNGQTVRHCIQIRKKGPSLKQNFTMIMFLSREGYTTRYNQDVTLHVAALTR